MFPGSETPISFFPHLVVLQITSLQERRDLEADLVLLAMGFTGPERPGLLEALDVELDQRGNVARDDRWATNQPGVFVCGDAGRGQSLIVWAIAEGRSCAASVDHHLMGETALPSPVHPTDRPLN